VRPRHEAGDRRNGVAARARRDRRSRALLTAIVATAALALGGCGNDSPPATSEPEAPPSPPGSVPRAPDPLATRVEEADRQLHRGIATWRSGRQRGDPPRHVKRWAAYQQRAVELLAERERLAAGTIRRLPAPLAGQTRDLVLALRRLFRLSHGATPDEIETGPPRPLPELLGHYRTAERRFGVDRDVLAAVNYVESAFGRVRTESVAGAQGPMQFVPATWEAYGRGGDIHDPRDAILAAANLLSANGAPADDAEALYAYNPSGLYVDAVLGIAGVFERDRDAVYVLYNWPP
jgi:Transglycosylase SLT domain